MLFVALFLASFAFAWAFSASCGLSFFLILKNCQSPIFSIYCFVVAVSSSSASRATGFYQRDLLVFTRERRHTLLVTRERRHTCWFLPERGDTLLVFTREETHLLVFTRERRHTCKCLCLKERGPDKCLKERGPRTQKQTTSVRKKRASDKCLKERGPRNERGLGQVFERTRASKQGTRTSA